MIQQEFEIRTPDGTADAILVRPEGAGVWPGVLHLTDVGGMRPAQIAMASRLAAEGYAVLVPNLFYRTSRPPVMNLPPGAGREEMMKRVAELAGPLTPQALERDAAAYVETLLGLECRPGDSRLGVVGHCLSGGMALRIAAQFPERIGACASFHGSDLYKDGWPLSPHLVLPSVRARLYFAYADKDPYMTAEAVQCLEAALAAWGGEYESETYAGAYHSWTAPDSPVYHPEQAGKAFSRMKELFRTVLQHEN